MVWHGDSTYTHKGVEMGYGRNSVAKGEEELGIFILMTGFIQQPHRLGLAPSVEFLEWRRPVRRPYPQVLHCQGLETGLRSN